MSWDSWTDNLQAGGAKKRGIAGQDGQPWSVKDTDGNSEQCKEVVRIIKTQDQNVFCTGVNFNNERWLPVRMEPEVLVMKGKEDKNKEQVMTVCLTKQAVVFGANGDSSTQGAAVRLKVEKMKSDLENAGY